MPDFSYKAISKDGTSKKGSIKAENIQQAYEALKSDGMIPVSVKEQSFLTKNLDIVIGDKVKARDLSVFCRQFVSIIQAGVPVRSALQMLMEQSENKYMRKAIRETMLNIEKGNTLADAMLTQSDVFPSILISMVEAGEASGSLETAFSRMATHFEKEARLKSMIRKAMVYPVVLIFACIGVIAVMLGFVIPKFIDMFADIDIEMPAITTFVINLSHFFMRYWYIVVLIVVAVIAAYNFLYRTEKGRLVIDDVKIHMPIFGKLTVKTACAQFARTVGTLLTTGISMTDCLDITANVLKNIHFKNALANAKEQVMKGVPLSEPLQQAHLFPPMVYHMTGIGEETGNLEGMLDKLADYYEEEVELTTETVMAAIEPLVIVFMAVVVGTLVIAVIMPIAAMYNGLEHI